MRRMLVAVVGLAFLLGAAAQGQAGERPALTGFKALSGKCLRVSVGERDFTGGCGAKLGILSYSDGRTGFYFMLADNQILTFSGKGKGEGGDRRSYVLDRVIFNTGVENAEPTVSAADGACAFGDPGRGPVTVRCKGTTAGGTSFSASFRSDGRPPKQ